MGLDARNAEQLRVRYLTEAIETATPAGRLVMLVDALEMDLAFADKAFAAGDNLKEISDRLIHAQEILLTLRDTLDTTIWEGAERLGALYDYLGTELLHANMDKDRARAAEVARHVSQLAAAWRQAATQIEAAVSA